MPSDKVSAFITRDGAAGAEMLAFEHPARDGSGEAASIQVPAPDAWDFACDCGVPIRLYWVAVADAVLHAEQQPWLDAARAMIGARS